MYRDVSCHSDESPVLLHINIDWTCYKQTSEAQRSFLYPQETRISLWPQQPGVFGNIWKHTVCSASSPSTCYCRSSIQLLVQRKQPQDSSPPAVGVSRTGCIVPSLALSTWAPINPQQCGFCGKLMFVDSGFQGLCLGLDVPCLMGAEQLPP